MARRQSQMPLPLYIRGIALFALLLAAGQSALAEPPVVAESEGKATLLGVEGKGTKVAYVFDRSGSMGVPANKPLNRAKKELLASIDALTELQQFYVIFYNHEQKMFRIDPTGRRLIFASDINKRLARQFIDGIEAGGGTRHVDALVMALRLNPDVIFMLTDGDPPDDLTADELARIERLNSGTVINVIQISEPAKDHDNLLVKLAEHSRGTHKYVDFNKADDAAEEKPAAEKAPAKKGAVENAPAEKTPAEKAKPADKPQPAGK